MNPQNGPVCRGVRGAVNVAANHPEQILAATSRLLQALFNDNRIEREDLAGIFFTQTPDLDAAFAARAAREMGLGDVPLMCAQEMPVPGGLPRCIRVMLLWNTRRPARDIRHVYLDGARALRPDLAGPEALPCRP